MKLIHQRKRKLIYVLIHHVSVTVFNVSADPDSLWKPHQREHVQQILALSPAALHATGKYIQKHKQTNKNSKIKLLHPIVYQNHCVFFFFVVYFAYFYGFACKTSSQNTLFYMHKSYRNHNIINRISLKVWLNKIPQICIYQFWNKVYTIRRSHKNWQQRI